MQYDIDTRSPLGEHFKTIRKILLSYSEIKELKNAKQTSYSDTHGMIIMMRTKGENLVLAFGKGHKLQEKYPQLQGNGIVVRHLYFKVDDSVDEALIREMIDESLILGLEAYEMKKLKCNSRV